MCSSNYGGLGTSTGEAHAEEYGARLGDGARVAGEDEVRGVLDESLHLLVVGEEGADVEDLYASLRQGVHEHPVVALELLYVHGAVEVVGNWVPVCELQLPTGVVDEDPLQVGGLMGDSEFRHTIGTGSRWIKR